MGMRLFPRLSGAIAGTCFLTGCAVTQVDVDVYKGPLANHEQVQVEQMAIMAAAARPLLVQLRNFVDKEGADLVGGQRGGYVCNWPKFDHPYRNRTSLNGRTNDNKTAEFVNVILSLYIDRKNIIEPENVWSEKTQTSTGNRTAFGNVYNQIQNLSIEKTSLETQKTITEKINNPNKNEISRLKKEIFVNNDLYNLANNLYQKMLQKKRECNSDFVAARLDLGLGSLAKSYIAEASKVPSEINSDGNPSSAELTKARFRLGKAMVGFAQRILFIANNQQLLSNEESSFFQGLVDRLIPVQFDNFTELDNQRAVLQAVGNAILIQVDEMENRQAFRDEADGGAVSEIAAIQNAYKISGAEYISGLHRDYAIQAAKAASDDKTNAAAIEKMIQAFTIADTTTLDGLKPIEAFNNLLTFVAAQAGSNDEPTATNARDVLAVLETQVPPTGWDPDDENSIFGDTKNNNGTRKNGTRKQALDGVIAILRQRHIDAVATYGADHEATRRANEALEAAYSHRAGFAYLRPAASYLRSVFATTDLQDNTSTSWRNLLAQQAVRTGPLGEHLENPLRPTREILSSLDKRSWQNINRVRVAGAGETNYVIAKDDVGNWYVKSYSADPKDIIKSATGLARFALGPSLGGANLLAGQRSEATTGAPAGEPTRSLVERVFAEHEMNYTRVTPEPESPGAR